MRPAALRTLYWTLYEIQSERVLSFFSLFSLFFFFNETTIAAINYISRWYLGRDRVNRFTHVALTASGTLEMRENA